MRRGLVSGCAPLLVVLGAVAVPARADAGDVPNPAEPTTERGSPVVIPASADHDDGRKVAMIQYGVGFAAEFVTAPGSTCPAGSPCILGSGGGLAARVGWRAPMHWYVGGAYEVAKLDSNKLYRLALLHQVRAEGRYYLETNRAGSPYVTAMAGGIAYGSEWNPDAYGAMGGLGVGASGEIGGRTLVGMALSYRVAYLSSFTDNAGTIRPAGVFQLFTIDVSLEARDPLPR